MNWWPSMQAVLDHLRDEDVLVDPKEHTQLVQAVRQLPTATPWYLKGALFMGGIFAAFVLACTCGPLGVLASGFAFLVPGVVALVACVGLRWTRSPRTGEWLDPLLFAGVMGGVMLFTAGTAMVLESIGISVFTGHMESILAGIVGVLELILLLAYPDRWHRTLGTIVVCACLSVISWDLSLWPVRDVVTGLAVALGASALALRPVVAGTPLREIMGPVGLGFVLYGLGGMTRFWNGWADEGWIVAVGIASGSLAVGVTAWTLARTRVPALGWLVALVGTLIVVLLGLSMPGLSVALSFLLLALLGRDLPVVVVSILALIAYGSWAYTDFDWPLALKALALVGSGIVLLGLRAYLRWTVPLPSPPAAANAEASA